MATKRWEGTESAKWTVANNWEGKALPGVTTEVQFVEAKNVACEINATNAKAKSIEFLTGYTAKITSTATAKVFIGTTTGTGTALKLTEAVQWEPNSAALLEFITTVGTVEKITCAGKTLPRLVFASAGKWQLADKLVCNSSIGLAVEQGELDTNGQTVELTVVEGAFNISSASTRTVKLGASLVKASVWNAATTTGLTFEAGTSTIEITGSAGAGFQGGGLTYSTVTMAATEGMGVLQANTFATLNINNKGAPVANGIQLEVGVAQTITSALGSNGTSGSKCRLESKTAGSKAKLKGAAGKTFELKNTIIKDVEAEGGATFIAGEGCTLTNSPGWTEAGAATEIAGVCKIKLKNTGTLAQLLGLEGTTKIKTKTTLVPVHVVAVTGTNKVTVKTTGALNSTSSVAGASKLRLKTTVAPLQNITVAGVTRVRFGTSANVKLVETATRRAIIMIFDE